MVKTKTTSTTKSTSTKTATRGRSSKHDDETRIDKELTSEQLQERYNKEVLRLKCSGFRLLTTGSKKQLAHRLYAEYHPTIPDPPPPIDIGDEEAPIQSVDTVPYGDEPVDNINDQGDKEDDDDQEEESSDESSDEGNHQRKRTRANRDQVNLAEIVQSVIEKSVGEEIKTMSAQMDAFRSQLTAMKAKQQPQPTLISTNSATSATATRLSPRKRKSDDGNNNNGKSKRSKQSTSSSNCNTGMTYFISNSNLTSTPQHTKTSQSSASTSMLISTK